MRVVSCFAVLFWATVPVLSQVQSAEKLGRLPSDDLPVLTLQGEDLPMFAVAVELFDRVERVAADDDSLDQLLEQLALPGDDTSSSVVVREASIFRSIWERDDQGQREDYANDEVFLDAGWIAGDNRMRAAGECFGRVLKVLGGTGRSRPSKLAAGLRSRIGSETSFYIDDTAEGRQGFERMVAEFERGVRRGLGGPWNESIEPSELPWSSPRSLPWSSATVDGRQ